MKEVVRLDNLFHYIYMCWIKSLEKSYNKSYFRHPYYSKISLITFPRHTSGVFAPKI